MSEQSGHRRRASRSELLPVAAVVLLGAILLGVATLWDGGVAATPDGTAPAAASIREAASADDDRARHDAEDREVNGELIDPISASADPRQPAANGVDQDLRIAAEAGRTTIREVSFRVATFNVLASQHTDGPGGWPDSGWRTPQTVGYIRNAGIDVMGLQEVKPGQLGGITAGTGFRAWPGGSDPDNSVIWDPAVFDFVSGDAFYITFMHGTRMQPIVRLRHKKTKLEFYFVNMHASAGGGPYAASRAAGHNTAAATVNRLKAEGIPIFLTGDMNDREAFFCRVLPQTGMVAAVGGSTAGGCRPPGSMPVDWIVATPDVDFSGFVNDKSTVARRVSDHHFVSATATIQGAS
ncbi:MAG TPA: endonuclease/exonuclease/phosphatase family protein [Nocardioides sp.]|nr:endonuclease/exonuclease/phosphatase family protein [Nocardioides sp.]